MVCTTPSLAQTMLISVTSLAAAKYDKDLVKLLLKSGVNPNSETRTMATTTLTNAAGFGFLKIVKILIKNGTELEFSEPLHVAAGTPSKYSGRLEVITYLLGEGIDI